MIDKEFPSRLSSFGSQKKEHEVHQYFSLIYEDTISIATNFIDTLNSEKFKDRFKSVTKCFDDIQWESIAFKLHLSNLKIKMNGLEFNCSLIGFKCSVIKKKKGIVNLRYTLDLKKDLDDKVDRIYAEILKETIVSAKGKQSFKHYNTLLTHLF